MQSRPPWEGTCKRSGLSCCRLQALRSVNHAGHTSLCHLFLEVSAVTSEHHQRCSHGHPAPLTSARQHLAPGEAEEGLVELPASQCHVGFSHATGCQGPQIAPPSVSLWHGAMAGLVTSLAPFSRQACVEGRVRLLCPGQGLSLETHSSSFHPQFFGVSFQILQPAVL